MKSQIAVSAVSCGMFAALLFPGCSPLSGGVVEVAIQDEVSPTGPQADHLLLVEGDNQSALVGTVVTISPKVKIVDTKGNPVAGALIQFAITDGGGSVGAAAALADDAGLASTSWTLGTSAGANTLVVTTARTLVGAPTSITFNAVAAAGAVSAGQSTVSAAPSAVSGDGISLATVTVTLKDAYGNPVQGKSVSLASSRGATDTIVTVSGVTSEAGVASFTVKSSTLGDAVLTATDTTDGLVVTGTATVSFIAGSANAGQSSLSAAAGSVVADGSASKTITITVRDALGNAVSGFDATTITVASTGSGNTITQPSGVTNASGETTATIKSTKAEVKTITLSAPAPLTTVASTSVTFVAGAASAANTSLSAAPDNVIANGSATTTISVTVRDANNNPVSGVSPTFTSSGSGNSINAPAATDANGQTSATMTSTVWEAKTISVSAPAGLTGTSSASVTFVQPAAAISSVTGPADATYGTGGNLDFTVNFSRVVNVANTPRLVLTIGAATRYANYTSGSGSSALVFRYTVQSGEADNDGIALTSPIELNGGTIQDGGPNPAGLAFSSPNLAGVKVDAAMPTISSINPVPGNATYVSGANLDFTVNFNKAVLVTNTPRLALTIGAATRYATYLSGSNSTALVFRYTIVGTDNDSDGIALSSPAELNGGTIKDASNNSADLAFVAPDLSGVKVDNTGPSVSSITAPTNAVYGTAQNLDFTYLFNENVAVTGTPRLALTIGAATRYANYVSGSGSTSLLFRYTTVVGDADADGISIASPIELNAGTLVDGVGNAATLTFTPPDLSGVTVVAPPVPTIGSVSPVWGETSGGTTVTITGTNFGGSTTVMIGGVACGSVNVSSESSLTCSAPARTGGAKDVAVSNGGTASTLTNGFHYCPANFSFVPNNTTYNTGNFCVANYEMKNVGGVATSQPALQPWTSITRATAASLCTAAGFSMITNAHWQTVAQNAELNGANWYTGVVGVTGMNRGYSNNVTGGTLASDGVNPYYGITNANAGQAYNGGWEQKRTHTLSSGGVIWDFAGNAWEFVADTWNYATYALPWENYMYAIPTANNAKRDLGPAGTYGSIFGLGYYALPGSGTMILRGGWRADGQKSGVFGLNAGGAATLSDPVVGFRCVAP